MEDGRELHEADAFLDIECGRVGHLLQQKRGSVVEVGMASNAVAQDDGFAVQREKDIAPCQSDAVPLRPVSAGQMGAREGVNLAGCKCAYACLPR